MEDTAKNSSELRNDILGKKKHKVFSYKNLRLSLKHRPEILRLILKLKLSIARKNALLKKLKSKLSQSESDKYNASDFNTCKTGKSKKKNIKQNDASVQTDKIFSPEVKLSTENKVSHCDKVEPDKEAGWTVGDNNEGEKKSIAEQVKEAAQSAMQQSGMVYVESAGMYYDYKTGYYYNSELGLYYHTNTSCYYYFNEDKQEFVFHSYPDRRKQVAAANVQAAYMAHEQKKARKQKKGRKAEEDVESITNSLSKGKENDGQPTKKKRKLTKKAKKAKATKKGDGNNKEEKNKATDKLDENKEEQEKIKSEDTKTKSESNQNDVPEDGEIPDDNDNTQIDEKVIEKDKTFEEVINENVEVEDGECSETDKSDSESDESEISTETASDDESVAKHHPPCMRIIVRETNIPKLKIGSLFLVTKDGGTLGREGDDHTILIRDTNVSRNHLDIRYDMEKMVYTATDLGSKNGTILNGSRMCESQVASEPMPVVHGSVIQLGETKLLCHIHPGTDTCGHCEPGLIMETEEKEKKSAYTRTCSVQVQHQLELARLKNLYAPKPLMIEDGSYNDRAKARREAVGSTHHAEKTETADIETSIAPENKGFKLLEKMGWSKGEGLGKDSQGNTEPIPLVSNEGKAGLGNAAASAPPVLNKPRVKVSAIGPGTLRLASRSKMLQPPAKAFARSDDDEEEDY